MRELRSQEHEIVLIYSIILLYKFFLKNPFNDAKVF